MTLSNNYKAELVRANITEEEVVEKVGITRQAFYNKKTEKTKFTGEEMRKIKNLINEKLNTNIVQFTKYYQHININIVITQKKNKEN